MLKSSPRIKNTAGFPEVPDVGRSSAPDVSAWEMVEAGRYMPRRIRGSFPGRELG